MRMYSTYVHYTGEGVEAPGGRPRLRQGIPSTVGLRLIMCAYVDLLSGGGGREGETGETGRGNRVSVLRANNG